MAQKITFESTGMKTYEVEFKDILDDNGNPVTTEISFNPTDKELLTRLKNSQNVLKEKAEIYSEDNSKDEDVVAVFEELSRIVHNEIDKIFNAKISSKLFKYCNPLSCANGEYFFVTVLEKLTAIIEAENKNESKKANSKIDAYMKKYEKHIKK